MIPTVPPAAAERRHSRLQPTGTGPGSVSPNGYGTLRALATCGRPAPSGSRPSVRTRPFCA